MGFPGSSASKESTCGAGDPGSWVGKIPWRRDRLPTPVFSPGESPWTEEPGGLQSMGSQRVEQESQHSAAGQAGKRGLEYHLVVKMPNDMLCC